MSVNGQKVLSWSIYSQCTRLYVSADLSSLRFMKWIDVLNAFFLSSYLLASFAYISNILKYNMAT